MPAILTNYKVLRRSFPKWGDLIIGAPNSTPTLNPGGGEPRSGFGGQRSSYMGSSQDLGLGFRGAS